MINHHPDDHMLVEYASGALAWALSLSVCTHLQFCLHCRKRVDDLNLLGGVILNSGASEKVDTAAFVKVMQRIRNHSSNATYHKGKINPVELHSRYSRDPMLKNLPGIIARLLPKDGKLKWQRISSTYKTAQLNTGQDLYEVAFQRVTRGGKILEHDHCGMEITLVLHGSFSDELGVYNEGDFLVRQPGEVHRPAATQNQDCLCLTVAEAPVKVTGFLGKLINPFLRFHPT